MLDRSARPRSRLFQAPLLPLSEMHFDQFGASASSLTLTSDYGSSAPAHSIGTPRSSLNASNTHCKVLDLLHHQSVAALRVSRLQMPPIVHACPFPPAMLAPNPPFALLLLFCIPGVSLILVIRFLHSIGALLNDTFLDFADNEL